MTETDFTNLDRRITAVARQMTDAAPPVDLHARVLAQLDERVASPWRWTWAPAAAAVLAVVLTAVVFVRFLPSSKPNPAAETSAAVRDNPPPGPQAGSDVGSIEMPDDTINHTLESRVARREIAPRISEVQAEWQARALPPLAQVQALEFESIQPDLLAIRPLETRPLVISPIGAEEDR